MRNITFLLIGIVLGAGALLYGYIRLEEAKTDEYIMQTHSTIMTKLQGIQQLATAKMTIQKVIEWQKDFSDLIPGFTRDEAVRKAFFDDALLMTVEANVNAGIDLTKLATGDIIVTLDGTGTEVAITLPPAEILDVYLTENTKPFERKLGILSKGNVELETKMRNDAVAAVRQEAIDSKILETAQENAREAIMDLVQKLGFSQVTVTVSGATSLIPQP